MVAEKNYLKQILTDAGVSGTIHESVKTLKNCDSVHVAAVFRMGETFTRSGSKKIYIDQDGQRKQRRCLFDRITVLKVCIADSNEEKVENTLTQFLKRVSKGVPVDANWVDIRIGDVDWVDEGDSILRSKAAIEFEVTFTGGIYVDVDLQKVRIGEIEPVQRKGI